MSGRLEDRDIGGSFRLRVLLEMALLELRRSMSDDLSAASSAPEARAEAATLPPRYSAAADACDGSRPLAGEARDPLCRIFDTLVMARGFAEQDGDAVALAAIETALVIVGDRFVGRLDALRAAFARGHRWNCICLQKRFLDDLHARAPTSIQWLQQRPTK